MQTEKEVTEPTAEELWLDKINAEAEQKAEELSRLLNAEVEPFVFIVESLKDAAIGYLKKPDAKQSFKIIRAMGTDYETGLELTAKAQLIRDYNGTIASDSRFMDVDGKYDVKDSELNLSLLMRVGTLIKPFSDKFKKK